MRGSVRVIWWSPTNRARGTRDFAPMGATSRPPTGYCTTMPPPVFAFARKRRGATTGLLLLAAFCTSVAGVGLYVLATPAAARQIVGMVLARAAGSRAPFIGSVRGSLWRGVTIHELSLSSPRGLPEASRLSASYIEIAPLAKLFQSPSAIQLHDVQLSGAPFAQRLSARHVQAGLSSGLMGSEVRAEQLTGLPQGSTLDLQRFESGWPLRLDRVRSISNGRLRLPYSEPMVFSGIRRAGSGELDVYARVLDLGELLEEVVNVPVWVQVRGMVREAHLALTGSSDRFKVSGTVDIAHVMRRDFALMQCPTTLALSIEPSAKPWRLEGEVACQGGTVQAKHATIAIQQARVTFSGDPSAPALDVRGTSRVGETAIRIALTGTAKRPQLALHSDPPRAERVLLMMLVSGKNLAGFQDALAQGVISSELATDAIDYFILGGAGGRLAGRLGISALSLTHDSRSNWVGVRAGLADKLSVSFETEPPGTNDAAPSTANQPSSSQGSLPYKVGAEMKITDQTSVAIEGERIPRESRPSSTDPGYPVSSSTTPQTDDQVLLKLKRKF